MHRAIKSCVLGICILGTVQISAQKVGIETLSPDSTLSIKNKIEIGGTHGDLLFTDDLGSITFPSSVLPNAPMIKLFNDGTNNADRMIFSHSSDYLNWGLQYRDTLDHFRFLGNGIGAMSIDLGSGRVAIGDAGISPFYTLNVATGGEIGTAYFFNNKTTPDQTRAIYASAFGTGSGNKQAGLFEVFGGTGVNYGIHSTAFFGTTNIGIYSQATNGTINRAAWFDAGDVIVDDQMLIGSSSMSDEPDPAALLEMSSTTKGLLLPRMTSTQRNNISSPVGGLVVYDNTLSSLYYHNGSAWQSLTGGGGGGHWTLDPSPTGIFYDGGNVGIGVSSISSSRRLDVQTSSSDFAGYFFNNTSSTGTIAAVSATALSASPGDKRGGSFDAQSGSGTNYGVWARALTGGTNIGVYGTASGGETDRAAWFDEGDVVVDEKMLIGSSSMTQEPESSAILELNSTTGGLLFPRMTSTQRTNILSPPGGLVVYDNTLSSLYYHDGSAWQSLSGGGGHWVTDGSGIHYDAGTVGIGVSAQGYIALNIDSNDDQIGINTVSNHTGSSQKFGVQSIATSLGTGIRYGVFSRAEAPSSGSAATYGVYGLASQGTSAGPAYGIFGDVSGSGSGERWAGYFDGSVRTSEQMVIGLETAGMPEPSAILDLQSTDKGLLLPRMTAAQRMGIGSPAEGLLVYDTDSSGVFVRRAASWTGLTGGGGSNVWMENGSPPGPYVTDYVGIGDLPQFFKRLYIESGTVLPYAIDLLNNYDGGLGKFGLRIEASSAGTNTRYGIHTKAWASAGNDVAYGIYAEGNQGTTSATVYGIYASAPGTGSGDRWAGYFEGNTKVTDELEVDGDRIKIQPTGYLSGARISLADDDGTTTIDLHGNQNPGEGAEIWMRDDAGNLTLRLDSDDGLGSSEIRMTNISGNDRIRLKGKEASSEGAEILMYNDINALSVEIDGDVGGNGSGAVDVYDEDGTRTYMLRGAEAAGQGSAMKMYDAAGNLTIELDADFGGDGRVITDELEIKGGSDLAEYFESSEAESEILPGQVVVIDPEHPGKVKLAREAYDKKVVGIISGANGIKPGMLMGQQNTIAFGDIPVAVAGRVYVRADESNGKIGPGDFLATSGSIGEAMKVTDWERARGSILGKALTYRDENGFVLVLVHLQ